MKMIAAVGDTVLGFVFIRDVAAYVSESWSGGQQPTPQLGEGFFEVAMAFMIISGGVNIYPQEIEDVLVLHPKVMHPKVMDVAVIGVPDEEARR